jgi:tetratricopeptide (TPR) repeat protein
MIGLLLAAACALAGNPSDVLDDARAAFRASDWPRAASGFETYVASNPYDGGAWHSLGFALHSLKRHDDAVRAWTKSAELGFEPASSYFDVACAQACAGRKDDAIAALARALDAGYVDEESVRTDPDLEAIRSDARYKELANVPPDGLSRDDRWRFDLDVFAKRVEKVHHRPFANVSREAFLADVEALKARVSKLRDLQIVFELQRVLAKIGDGHTMIAPWRHRAGHAAPAASALAVGRLPVQLHLFTDGLFVRAAAPEVADAAGGRVVSIGRATAERALEAARSLCSADNEMGVRQQSPFWLTLPDALDVLGLVDDPNAVPLVVEKPDGRRVTVTLKPGPLFGNPPASFVRASAGATSPPPLRAKNPDAPFWREWLADRKVVYWQWNAIVDGASQTLADFAKETLAFCETNRAEALVIDLRENDGGNNQLLQPVVHALVRSDAMNRKGHLFVLVGRRTFSAAMNAAAEIERNTKAIFAGEPTGSSPNHVGEGTVITLPCSGLPITCASLYWQSPLPTDHRKWIAPRLLAEASSTDEATRRDPAMDAILAYLETHTPPSPR